MNFHNNKLHTTTLYEKVGLESCSKLNSNVGRISKKSSASIFKFDQEENKSEPLKYSPALDLCLLEEICRRRLIKRTFA